MPMSRSSAAWRRNPFVAGRIVHGRSRADAQIQHDFRDGCDKPVEIVRLECADTADAKAFRPGELAGIDDEAARRQCGVEVVEAEARIVRRAEGDDDRSFDALIEKAAE